MSSQPQKALNLNLVQQLDFIRFYRGLPEKSSSTVRFFNRNDYYSLHGDDTDLAAQCLSSQVKYMGEEPKLSYVTVNKGQFELFLRELLIVRQYRVEVYIKKSPKENQWSIEYKGSPGNLSQFEDLLFENAPIDFTNCIMSIKICPNKLLAIGCVNVTECKFEVCEITDNDSFSELEGLIAQIGPKECILPNGETPDLVALNKVLARNGILVAKVKMSDFSEDDIAQDLNRLLYFLTDQQRNCFSYHETNLNNAMGCLNVLIKFLNIAEDEKNFNQFKLSTLDARRFVRIDNAALFALHVLPKTNASSNNFKRVDKSFSLKGLLDYCATAQGSRLLEQWIKQPLRDIQAINERLEVVQCILTNAEVRTQLVKEWLPRITDLVPLSRKIGSKKASLQDCYKVYSAVSTVPAIIKVLRELKNTCVNDMLIDPLVELSSDMQNFQNMIEQTLDFDLVHRAEFLIKSSFDVEGLTELAEQKAGIQEKMQKLLTRAASDLDLEKNKSVKLEYTKQLGYFFRVTLKDEKLLRKRKDYQIVGAIKGGVRFTNSKLSDLSDNYKTVNEKYKKRQTYIEKKVVEVASEYADCLKTLNMHVAKVDVLTSFAIAAVSARIPYVKPKLLPEGSGILKLKKVRYPCIEAQENISFIPNDVTFDKDGKRMFIITGPNMCGKSTYIRSIGTAVLMAHIGSLVPCSAAEISIVDAILVRVGAEDCQLKGLSTFMLEMIETSMIIKTSTSNSLVIIDELGRGTSTYDGCGLAWSIAEHIAKEIKCFSLFATHFNELNQLAGKTEFVGNLHVSAIVTDEGMTPSFSIREGECDKSYGIHCARLVEFPDDVIQDAIKYQTKLEHQNGLKYIKDFEPKNKTKIIAEGDEIIKNTLKKFKSL